MKNIVVFASGYGSNFQAIIDAVEAGRINADIRGLIVNKTGIGAIKRACKHQVPYRVLNPRDFTRADLYAEDTLQQLHAWKPDLIVLAGYMLKVPDKVVDAFPGRIINIHPSLLPRFSGKGYYGLYVHQAVLDAGEKETGCTVHIVDNIYDNGPVIAQARVPVLSGDTAEDISKRVRKKELELLPGVIADLMNDPGK
ncbi:MAG: phosphoribosylglycinamide formyltransferase [Balneolales bacterium]